MNLILCDVETTNLDPKTGLLLEVAMIRVDTQDNWAVIDTRSITLSYDRTFLRDHYSWDDGVWDMHTESSLIEDCVRSNWMPTETEQELIKFVTITPAGDEPIYFAARNPSFDRAYVKRYFPKLEAMFDYHNFDLWTARVMLGGKELNPKLHRALPDLFQDLESIKHPKIAPNWTATLRRYEEVSD